MLNIPRLLLLFIAGIFLISCKQNSIIILKKEVEYQLPGRKEGTKAAHYRIQFIAQTSSYEWSVQRIMMDDIELSYEIYDNSGNKQNAFNANDTVNIKFSRLSNNIQQKDLPSSTIKLYYFKNNKLKSTSLTNFTLHPSPINQ